MEEKFDLVDYLPKKIVTNSGKEYSLKFEADNDHIKSSYTTEHNNNSQQEHYLSIKKIISKNQDTFEVLGLLQAEMGKTQNGCVVFANSEPKIINKVIKWFEKEQEITKDTWKWYIKVNMQDPSNQIYKEDVEKKVINYWLNQSKLNIKKSYPKKVVYTKTEHQKLKEDFYGTLMIEYKNNLYSQVFKRFLKMVTYNKILYENLGSIKSFMKGIIAGEGCIELDPTVKKFRVHISATQIEEKVIYVKLLKLIDIDAYNYSGDKIVISRRENLIQLLKQRLMVLHPRKYSKFLNMMKLYPGITEETGYFSGIKKAWHKLPQEKVDQVLELYKSGLTRTEELAKKAKVSPITINRILKRNNLGKRVVKTEESLRKEIAEFAKNNPKLILEEVAKKFNVSEQTVSRSYKKYYGKRGMTAKCKIPEEIEKRIIEIYKSNPTVKYSEIMKELKISDYVITRVRKENNLLDYGYKHLVGNNNRKYKSRNEIIVKEESVAYI